MTDVVVKWQSAELSIDVSTVECAFADRVKPRPFHDLLGLSRRRNMGHDDPGSVGFKRKDVGAVASAGNANKAVDVMHAGGADLAFNSQPVIGNVLRAEPDRVCA